MHVSFPPSLLILNRSTNQISTVELQSPLPSLRLLNLSFNRISRITQMSRCPSLCELFISHNRLSRLTHLCPLSELTLLDAGYNLLSSFESIAGLTVNANLMVLRLVGNPVKKAGGYAGNVRRLLPAVQHLDPSDVTQFSEFVVGGNEGGGTGRQAPPSPSFHPVAVKHNWGQVDKVSSPSHFHELVNPGTISAEKSYAELVSRVTPALHLNGFWSSVGSARSSQRGAGENSKDCYFPESPIRTSKKPAFKRRTYEPSSSLPLQPSPPKRPKVPKLLLSKVLQTQV